MFHNLHRRALSSQPTPYQVLLYKSEGGANTPVQWVLLYKSVGGANTPVQWVAIMNSLKSIRPFWSLRLNK